MPEVSTIALDAVDLISLSDLVKVDVFSAPTQLGEADRMILCPNNVLAKKKTVNLKFVFRFCINARFEKLITGPIALED